MKRGYTLLETLLAVGILSALAVTLIGMITYGIRLASQNRDGVVASQLIQQMLEQVRAQGLTPPPVNQTFAGSDPPILGFPPPPYPSTTVAQVDYRFVVQSQPVAGRQDLYSVRVQALWGSQHRVDIETYVFHP